MQRLTGAALTAALSRQEKSLLTCGIYDASPIYKELAPELFAVEELLFARDLPTPPARILVGACGAGREAIALAARGYCVHAFDPAPRFVAESRRRLGGGAAVARLSYEELNATILDEAPAPAPAGFAPERFDAVVLGCGSLSHVLEVHEQRRLFRALDALCPSGPMISSFLWTKDGGGEPAFVGRATRWGGAFGQTLARLRGMACDASPSLSYHAERGFAYTFTQREIEQLGRSVGRNVIWEQEDMQASPYASFVRNQAREAH